MKLSALGTSLLLVALTLVTGCGRGPSSGTPDTSPPPGTSPARVAVVVLENLDYNSVVGNSSAPYLNQLATQKGLATNYFADTHPSIGNYFMMTTGELVTSDDNGYSGPYTGDNLARELAASGKSWKVYAQSLPSVGYTGTDQGAYIKHHNPFAYFSDVVGTAQANNIVPLTQLSSDVGSGTLPDFLFIIPDNLHNGHDCPGGGTACDINQRINAADSWVQQTVGSLLSSSGFSNGVLVVTFDESDFNDSTHGGGHIMTVVAGPAARGGAQDGTFLQHESLLRFICDRLALKACPGAGAGASSAMSNFVQGNP